MVLMSNKRRGLSKNEKARRLAAEKPVAWDPGFKFQNDIVFSGQQFKRWSAEAVPEAADLRIMQTFKSEVVQEHGITFGKYVLFRRCMPMWEFTQASVGPFTIGSPYEQRCGLTVTKGAAQITAYFDKPTPITVMSRVADTSSTVMSLTPWEVLSQRAGVRRAKGCVLVAGLGLGWFAEEVAKKKNVKAVTIVDINKPLLDVIGARVARRTSKPVTLVHQDVYKYLAKPKAPEYDRYLFDIWDSFGTANGNRQFEEVKAAHEGKVWGWGDVTTLPDRGRW